MPSKDFPQTHSGMSDALTFVESEVRRLGAVEDQVVDRVVLVAGEVLANAVEHGGSDSHQLVRVDVTGSAASVELAIWEGPDAVSPHRFEEAHLPRDVLATEGRGLFLIRSLSDAIESEDTRGLRFTFSPRSPS